MNILLINPSSMPASEQEAFLLKSSVLRVPSFTMPIGLIDLAAYIRRELKGINIKILDMGKELYSFYLNQTRPPVTLRQFIEFQLNQLDFVPQIVGISNLFSTSHNTSLLIAELIKKKWKKVIVVFGGNHATNMYKILLSTDNIDYVIRGEGEIPFTELVKKIENKEDNINVWGVSGRNNIKDKSIELSKMLENLDELPFPAIDLLDIEFYKKTVGVSVMFSRGCSFKCAFCSSHTVHGRTVRFKSRNRILSEFENCIKGYGFKRIIIEDDLFAARKKIFLDIAEKLSSYKDIKYLLPQGLSVAVLNEEIIDAMIKMGIDEAAVAIESGSVYVQKNIIKKNVSLPKAKHILQYLRGKDFSIYANFILGFPGETREMMQETIDFINTIDVDWVYIFHALPLPGSEIYEQLVEKKIIDPYKFDWNGMRLGRRVFDTPEITAIELEKLIYDVNIEANFFNNSNLRHKRYQKAIDIFNRFIIEPYPYHIVGRYCCALAYLGLNQKDKALNEFRESVKWINNNDESKRLFNNYGSQMMYLQPHLKCIEGK